MNAFLISTLTVGIAEIGDRSLFLAILLGIQYRRPWPVFWGMSAGLFVNQLLSAILGVWLFSIIPASWQAMLVGSVFLIMAVWVLVPEDENVEIKSSARGIFFSSALAFFILEMADKTQIAVITLAGYFESVVPVVMGATLGILAVTTPALWLGCKFSHRLPVKSIKVIASVLFAVIGMWIIIDSFSSF
ncbi:TMEM165/GDT1 family protein [Desulfonatronovibrio magnus]|uniref:TMEM165/GDT1 family protein n=1 Tax=Desulfonatronovibrio magnus TaxID=698827 RepID=UPI0005EBA2DF|nr:TMEM165/GDT1 family protein [Desulfonatronovibrio magnus]